MKETIDLTRQILENHFSVHESDSDAELELETWTDGGVNMIIYVDKHNIIEDFCSYIESFDIDEELEIYRQDKRYRDNFTIRESLEDFEAYKSWLENIAEQLKSGTSEISTSFLVKHNNYIDALKEAVYLWDKASTVEDKTLFIKAIGEIGYKIHQTNIMFHI